MLIKNVDNYSRAGVVRCCISCCAWIKDLRDKLSAFPWKTFLRSVIFVQLLNTLFYFFFSDLLKMMNIYFNKTLIRKIVFHENILRSRIINLLLEDRCFAK